ncbi:MAG: LamG domain-containing protein [Candidatus Marinimicrobia bacterium]|nr:LamG domain-containing protein [Candidatus Neomarinimicrobiota bacterium]
MPGKDMKTLLAAGLIVAGFVLNAVGADGLLAEWRLDEGQGQLARDSSGQGRDARIEGGAWTPLGEGYALALDGENDHVVFDGLPPLGLNGPVSVEAWVKPEAAAERLTILLGQDLHSYLLALYGSDRIGWYIGSGANQLAAKIQLREWNHIVATFDGQEMRLWLNGRDAGRRKSAVDAYPLRDKFSMASSAPQLPHFQGFLSNVRVYNRALSQDEVMAHFTIAAAAHGLNVAQGGRANTSHKEATRFFKSHPNEIDVVAKDASILFANRQVGLEFVKSATGFEIIRLYGIGAEQDFLVAPTSPMPRDLFAIRMATDPKFVPRDDRGTEQDSHISAILDRMAELGDVVRIGSQAAKSVSWRAETGADSTTLHLEWQGMDVRNEKAVLDATVSITLRAGDPLSYWRVALKNRSARNGIERVRMPILPLAPIGEATQNVLVYPKWRGGYLEDPFHAPAGLGENYHTTGAYYPYYTDMQFWALYNQNDRQGVYVGTQDPTPNMTHILVANTPEEINWSIAHFPPNMSFAAEDFALPYDCVAGPFRGDWYDAAQIYRAWAVQQSWCRKGPLSERADVPVWFKETPLFLYTIMNDSATGTYSMDENLQIAADQFREWLRWTGVPLPLKFYTWHDYDPGKTASNVPFHHRRDITAPGQRWSGFPLTYSPFGNYPKTPAMPALSETLASLRKQGGMVTPYVCLQVYDPGPLENSPYAKEGKPNMVLDSYGRIHKYPGMNMWYPCVASAWWQERLIETCTLLVEREHAAGVYLDVMHGVGMPCFWRPHGHSHGGGSSMTVGMHTLSDRIRDAIQAKDPDAITTGESSTENMIDAIDGVMYQYTLRPENKVPLFGVVYNDYITRTGREMSVSRPSDFFIEAASLFVEGAQIGRFRTRPRSDILQFDNPAHKEMFDFLGRMVGYYKQEGTMKFLAYGRLLRPLAFTAPSPMPQLVYGTSEADALTDIGAGLGEAAGLRYPALMSGVFHTEDGEYGIFVANPSAQELAFSAEWNPTQYGAPADAAFDVDAIQPDGTSRRAQSNHQGAVTLHETLPVRGIVMFRIAPASR